MGGRGASSSISKVKTYTTKEIRQTLRNMTNYSDETIIGKYGIVKTSNGYGIRNKNDEPDAMTDYSPYTWGFKEKWIIERLQREGYIKN